MTKKLILLLVLLLSGPVFAESVTLSWTAPTQNEDGTPLTNLAGYKLYYGTATGNYPTIINIPNPAALTFMVDNLTVDETYYFVGTAYNTDGIESRYSNEAVKTVEAAFKKPKPPLVLTFE